MEFEADHLKQAKMLFDEEKYEDVLNFLEPYLDSPEPGSYELSLAAVTYFKFARIDEGQQAARAAVEADPSNAFAHFAMAQAYRFKRDREAAYEAMDVALGLEPADPEFLVFLSELQIDDGLYDKGMASARLAWSLAPDLVGAPRAIALALTRQGQHARAAEILEPILLKNPLDSVTRFRLAWLAFEAKDSTRFLKHSYDLVVENPLDGTSKSLLLEALVLKYPAYGYLLRGAFALKKHSRALRQSVMMGSYVLDRLLGELLRKNRKLAALMAPLLILWKVFVFLVYSTRVGTTWLLRMNRYARCLVSSQDRIEANLVGTCWAVAFLLWAYHIWIDPFTYIGKLGPSVCLSLPLLWMSIFECPKGRVRQVGYVVGGVLSVLALGGMALLVIKLGLGLLWLKIYASCFSVGLLLLSVLSSQVAEEDDETDSWSL